MNTIRRFFIPAMWLQHVVVLAVITMLFTIRAYAQGDPGGTIGAGEIVDALTVFLTYGVGWALRSFVFPKLEGLAFLSIVILVVTPALAWIVNWAAELYNVPGNSYLQSVIYGLLSVIVSQVQIQWQQWQNKRKGVK